MGRWLRIFLPLAETPDDNTIRGIADPDPTSLAPHKENRTTRRFKSNRLYALHPIFLRHKTYFNSLTRNAEAFSQIAARLKDTIFLTDEELYSVICSHINKEYSVKTPSQLSAQQKIDTARHMHFGYNASNQQLRRMLRLDLAILEELFP